MTRLPENVQKRVDRLILLLDDNRSHPSLHLKRIKRLPNHWEMRVSDDLRIILMIEDDTYTLLAIGRHEILDIFKNN